MQRYGAKDLTPADPLNVIDLLFRKYFINYITQASRGLMIESQNMENNSYIVINRNTSSKSLGCCFPFRAAHTGTAV